ncbi:3-oxoacyl-[acyl-carrier-protein] synthase 2 [Geodia barretti]|uniref:3-oxoacyl-[acyl-carrier-protein] synthase n=4 Tax=Geodia barretti TaxID=519541 RepID=A0AA35SLD0_GEOBA|nr:3-oxoacyl-[acyl-carrier-protein] synthase 2 [Geodia barretti]
MVQIGTTGHRVVVTGLGIISPLGLNTSDTWNAVVNGRSGIDYITSFDAEAFDTRFAAEVKGFTPEDYLDRKLARRMDRFSQFAAVAAMEACQQANLEPRSMDRYSVHVVVGSGVGGINTLTEQHRVLMERGPRRVTPFLIPMMLADMGSAQVSMVTGAMGANYCVTSSCSSGADAIGIGWDMIRHGRAEVVLAGGTEAPITPLTVAGFNALRALSRKNDDPQRASQPFNRSRDGFVLAEGSAILVLESEEHAEARGAEPLAELRGYAATSDSHHLTEPNPTGQSAAAAVTAALAAAQLSPVDVDYLNAHGTSTPLNDWHETKALKLALGEDAYRIPISSTKSMTGHLLGAGGALEAALCAIALREGLMPPTINLDDPGRRVRLGLRAAQCAQGRFGCNSQ